VTIEEKVLGTLGLVALAGAFFLAHAWLGEHDARLTAEASSKAAQQGVEQAAARMKDLAAQDASRAAQEAATLEQMRQLVAQVKTPAQIAPWIAQQAPAALPQPITVNIPPATPQNPAPNATFSVPQQDLPAIRDAVEGCRECSLKLQGATQDAASKAEQLQAASQQLAAMTAERDAWKKASKGTFWSHAKSALKYFAIGAGVGVVATCGSGHCR
jgi:hypothetical protein